MSLFWQSAWKHFVISETVVSVWFIVSWDFSFTTITWSSPIATPSQAHSKNKKKKTWRWLSRKRNQSSSLYGQSVCQKCTEGKEELARDSRLVAGYQCVREDVICQTRSQSESWRCDWSRALPGRGETADGGEWRTQSWAYAIGWADC